MNPKNGLKEMNSPVPDPIARRKQGVNMLKKARGESADAIKRRLDRKPETMPDSTNGDDQ